MKLKFLFLGFIIPVIIYSQDADNLLNEIQNNFESIGDFKAEFTQTAKQDAKTIVFQTSGIFYYKKGNKFRVELGSQTIVSDNESLWNYNEMQKRLIVNNVTDDPSAFSIEKYIMEYPAQCNVSVFNQPDDKDNAGILLIPKNLDLEFNSVKLWTNDDKVVNKIELVDLNDMTITIVLKNIKVNQSIADSKFTFVPPKGCQIVDLR